MGQPDEPRRRLRRRDESRSRRAARLAGELHELLALDLDESDYALAAVELGMEVDPPAPYGPSGWLASVAGRLVVPRADYGPPVQGEQAGREGSANGQ
ncbi:contact-dependent growth inhibition system immunity protein [Streptomyces sp. DH41]|nr:contact-dependent growth inhibition system immunity protein [Streptomyces sp. DH41]MDG9723515.1 contact-dependent growth inhibition system immunity protein [Streptomyces sp. DH41]